MSDFVAPPSNYSMKMRDGTVYLPSKSGTYEVKNRRHAEEIRNSKAMKTLDMIKEKTFSVQSSDEIRRCNKCLFALHAFSKISCPRCGHNLEQKEAQHG